jgi:serine/threonine protein phosphatase 1
MWPPIDSMHQPSGEMLRLEAKTQVQTTGWDWNLCDQRHTPMCELLQKVFAAIDLHLARAGPARALHLFLGDYIDRGPASRQTIDLLIDRSRRHKTIFLRGNHEAFLFKVLQDANRLEAWKEYGGFQTLMSYGLTASIKPDREEQMNWSRLYSPACPTTIGFSHLKPSFSAEIFFAHARVKPGVPLRRQHEEDLLWIRDEFLSSEKDFGKFVVHGHTPSPNPTFDRTGSTSILELMGPAF